MKKRSLKRLLAGLLSAVLAVTSVPVMEAKAESPLETLGLAAYDYTRMESILQDGKGLSYRNNSTGAEKVSYPMSFGEMVYLQFALPYNVNYDVKVLDENGSDLGYLYGKYYGEHITGTPDAGYTPLGKSMAQIKQELKLFVYGMPYTWANDFTGLGLTGETLPWSTLAEYYAFHDTAESGEEDMPGEDGGQDTVPEEDGELEQDQPESEDSESGPAGETVSGNDMAAAGDVAPKKTLLSALSSFFTLTAKAAELPDVDVSGNNRESHEGQEESGQDADGTDETVKDVSGQDIPEIEMAEEMQDIPEDFYIRRDFRTGTFGARAAAEQRPDLIHNFIVWKGEVIQNLGDTPAYLQPGNYTIQIIPKAQSLLPITLPFVIGGSGADGALTEEDILGAIYRDMVYFPGFSSGYPSLKFCTGGDPVDLLSGSLNWTYTDLTLDGKHPLTFTRTYLSGMREIDDSGLGNGWSHNYSYRAEMFEGNVDVYLPGGGHIYYYLEYDNTYTTNKGNAWHLEDWGEGYRMYHDNGQEVYFDGDGYAVRIAEAGGNVITLTYEGGRLSTVSNTSGSFHFSYSGEIGRAHV